MIESYQAEALTTRLAIPILYGIDAVHGLGHMTGATDLPAQHRSRRGERCGSDAPDRPGDRGGDAGRRDQLEFRAGGGRPAGHPLGADVRGLRRTNRPGRRRSARPTSKGCNPYRRRSRRRRARRSASLPRPSTISETEERSGAPPIRSTRASGICSTRATRR